jgi:hypothetical protein
MIFQERYDRILGACEDLRRHRGEIAKSAVGGMLAGRVDAETPDEELLSHLCAAAMLRRMDRAIVPRRDIYLQRFELSQIDLFYTMCSVYPQVPAGHRIANQLLAAELRGHERATLLDVGIGRGLQILALLRGLAAEPGRLRRLDVVGVDPDGDNLDAVAAGIDRALPLGGLDVRFHRIEKLLEECDEGDYDAVRGIGGGIAVNAAYSLHHTQHPPRDRGARTELVRRLASLRPRLFTLVEPSADHDTESLPARLSSCWEHFGAVFELISRADADPARKLAVKETFFGREIADIVGTSDAFRCERHEPYEAWLLRLAKAGLEPAETCAARVGLPSYCEGSVGEGIVRLGYRGQCLVAVFAYRSPTEMWS